jgi:hypothetical protein
MLTQHLFQLMVHTVIADKVSLVRARRHRKVEVNELRAIKQGFPASTKPRMASAVELEEDLAALGVRIFFRALISCFCSHVNGHSLPLLFLYKKKINNNSYHGQ